MKKILLIIVILVVIFLLLRPFFKQIFRNINSFEDMEWTDMQSKKIESDYLLAKNIVTNKIDTISTSKPLIINFWATYCTPCLEELPQLQNIATQRKVKIVLFSNEEKDSLAIVTLSKMSINLPAHQYMDTSVFGSFNILPRTVILKDKQVIFEKYGQLDFSDTSFIKAIDFITF